MLLDIEVTEAELSSYAASETASRPACTLQLGGLTLCIPATIRLEYLEELPVFAVPQAQARLLGLAQSRGRIFPVFDPHPMMRVRSYVRGLSVLLMESEGMLAGCWVDHPPSLLQGEAARLAHQAMSQPANLHHKENLDVPFAAALGHRFELQNGPCWTVDLYKMLELLASQGYSK